MQIRGDRVRALRGTRTQQDIAKRVTALGVRLSQQQLAAIESGEVLRPRCLPELAEALHTSVDYLIGRSSISTPEPQKPMSTGHKNETGNSKGLRRSDAGSTLDVWETTAGGGHMERHFLRNNPVDSVARPDQLKEAKKALAFRILDDRQEPAFRTGDIAYVDRMRPAAPGEDCLLARRDPETREEAYHILASHLLGETRHSWKVRQYNPRRDYEVPKAEWPEAWKIQGKYSR